MFERIQSAAHDGDFGLNSRAHPTLEQIRAGNYKKGRTRLYGLPIAIETPQGQRRTGKSDGKPWSVICMAHYGYIAGTKGADGDAIDVYIGPWPEAKMVYVVNQNNQDGSFDEAKVMLAFPTEEAAKAAYMNSYERGWTGFGSMVPCTIEQFKWWLKYGNTTIALTPAALPYDPHESENMTTAWDSAANPVGTDIAGLLYELRRDDADGALLDACTVEYIINQAGGGMALDALIVPFKMAEKKMAAMQRVMEAAGDTVRVTAMQVTPPFKQRGTTNVAAIFELSDGQTVSIFFHNPDTTPNKIAPDDELVSWKWMLNKKDITILVAPEKGEDLNVREVARRIMRIAEKNSAKFAAANKTRADRLAAIDGMKDQVAAKEGELAQLDAEIADLTAKVEAKRAAPAASTEGDMAKAKEIIQGSEFRRIASDIASSLSTIRGIDTGEVRGYDRALFVSSIVGKISRTAAKNPLMGSLLLAMLSMAQKPFAKPAVTMRNGVWNAVDGWEKYQVLFEKLAGTPAPASSGKPDVSSREGQMYLANRAATIAALKAMNGQLRQIAPNEAWSDAAIEEAADLDALRTSISEALVNANRGASAVTTADEELQAALNELSGQEVKAVSIALGASSGMMTSGERIDYLMKRDKAEVMAAIQAVTGGGNAVADADAAFIRTVIDGSADLYDKSVTDRLASLAGQYKDGEMADLLKQAKTAAKQFFIAEFQKKTAA